MQKLHRALTKCIHADVINNIGVDENLYSDVMCLTRVNDSSADKTEFGRTRTVAGP